MNLIPRDQASHIKLLNVIGFKITSQDLDTIIDRLEHMSVRPGGGLWIQYKELLTELIFAFKQTVNFVDDYPMLFPGIVNVIIDQLKRQDDLIESLADYASALFSVAYPACGNNSDWGLPAWYVGLNEPNEENGDRYILDHGDGKYTLTQRTYLGDGDDRQLDLISIDVSAAQSTGEGREMLHLLDNSAAFILLSL